jgi:hypothetical protein
VYSLAEFGGAGDVMGDVSFPQKYQTECLRRAISYFDWVRKVYHVATHNQNISHERENWFTYLTRSIRGEAKSLRENMLTVTSSQSRAELN